MSDTPPPSPLAESAPLRCAAVRPYLSAYVDGELAEPLRSRVARHVAGCAECAARAESYRATDALLARLPGTAPAPEVFHAVMAAAREQNAEPVERETLPAPLAGPAPLGRLAARRLRVVRPEPREMDLPAVFSGTRGKSWVATAMPAIAALLLVTLAALAFRGLVTLPQDSKSAATSTPTLTILEQTQAQVAAVSRTTKLPFTPILPTYAPPWATSVDVKPGYADDGKTVIALDIVWNMTPNANLRKIHIRESANSYEYPGYKADTSENASGWQLLDNRSWQPLTNETPEQLSATDIYATVAAGQHRVDNGNALYIAVEAIGIQPRTSRETLLQTLRQVTLSMDVENKPISLAALQANGLILHYKAQSRVAAGETPAWSVEVYINPATNTQHVEVWTNGTKRYVDVSQGTQQGYRWDAQTNTYATGPRSSFSGDMNPDIKVTQIFYSPGDLLQTGLLWYSGQNAKLQDGTSVYDYILVSAPNPTHVYIDQRTHQVVQVRVDTYHTWNNPPPTDNLQLLGRDGCSYYTTIEYTSPDSTPARTFSLTPPPDSHQGTPPQTLTCSS